MVAPGLGPPTGNPLMDALSPLPIPVHTIPPGDGNEFYRGIPGGVRGDGELYGGPRYRVREGKESRTAIYPPTMGPTAYRLPYPGTPSSCWTPVSSGVGGFQEYART